MIYEFYDRYGSFVLEIGSSSIEALEPEVIEKVLRKYLAATGLLNATIGSWMMFLEQEGYSVKEIKIDYSLNFN